MGKYFGKISNIWNEESEETQVEGEQFECTNENLSRFNLWWKRINIEHGIVFWATGALTMIMLSILSYATVYKHPNVATSINFVILEAVEIGNRSWPILGSIFLVLVGVMLFGTQFSVFGSTRELPAKTWPLCFGTKELISNCISFFGFLWLQISCWSDPNFCSGFYRAIAVGHCWRRYECGLNVYLYRFNIVDEYDCPR